MSIANRRTRRAGNRITRELAKQSSATPIGLRPRHSAAPAVLRWEGLEELGFKYGRSYHARSVEARKVRSARVPSGEYLHREHLHLAHMSALVEDARRARSA